MGEAMGALCTQLAQNKCAFLPPLPPLLGTVLRLATDLPLPQIPQKQGFEFPFLLLKPRPGNVAQTPASRHQPPSLLRAQLPEEWPWPSVPGATPGRAVRLSFTPSTPQLALASGLVLWLLALGQHLSGGSLCPCSDQ